MTGASVAASVAEGYICKPWLQQYQRLINFVVLSGRVYTKPLQLSSLLLPSCCAVLMSYCAVTVTRKPCGDATVQ